MKLHEGNCRWLRRAAIGVVFGLVLPSAENLSAQMPRVVLDLVSSSFDDPVGIAHAGDGSGRLFVVERRGKVWIVESGGSVDGILLDITERIRSREPEQGLLGLAFHPNFRGNGYFFVNYTDGSGDTRISRFTAPTTSQPAGLESEVEVVTMAQPAANHNGGHLAFGPDGYLYIGMGDGGGGGDTYGNGQDGGTLLGAMLRIDVDPDLPYSIPSDNPFVGVGGLRNEIWAIGLRNPWRFSFDRQTGDLYIADVGQNDFEEVNFQPASSLGGENYGWPVMEGAHCYPLGASCETADYRLPVYEYDHGQGCSITGGYVYRGSEFSAMDGVYVFGDFCSGRIWGLLLGGTGSPEVAELGRFDLLITSFGEDESGELYVTGSVAGNGGLYRMRFVSP